MRNNRFISEIILKIIFISCIQIFLGCGCANSQIVHNLDAESIDIITTESVTPTVSYSNIAINAEYRAQNVFRIKSNWTEYQFDIYNKTNFLHYHAEYKLSVVVEKILCRGLGNYLVLEGIENLENKMTSIKYCLEEDNEKNNFQTVEQIFDDVKSVKIRAEGDWTGLEAQIVVSIYYEVEDGCHNCGQGDFCCGTKEWCSVSFPTSEKTLFRCIPKYFSDTFVGRDGKTNLICNGHPNCGFYCNADESTDICSTRDISPICWDSNCHLTEIAIRLVVLILFCFVLPPIIILIICRFQSVRKLVDRINDSLTFSTRGERRNNEESNGNASHICRHQNTTSGDQISPSIIGGNAQLRPNLSDDPPPSYDDFLRSLSINKNNDSSPTGETINVPTTSQEMVVNEERGATGFDNSAFIHSDTR